MTWLVKLELSLECGSLVRLVSILRSKIWVGLLQVKIVWFKLIIFLTLIFGWKNEKQPSGPIDLTLKQAILLNFKVVPYHVDFSSLFCHCFVTYFDPHHMSMYSN